ncbi:hypothetical protein AYI68_g6775 [Smittium mucronatum]|uniref:Uncharacterized protein n=1 Tax=Smittium mucronatum TaxID=133383 RepID=A0A1R0GQL5_9FUNG|nr:hypothetical protein AYI68_g6775 [Smittium mucronatum]
MADPQMNLLLQDKISQAYFDNSSGGWYQDCYNNGYRSAAKIHCWSDSNTSYSLLPLANYTARATPNNRCVTGHLTHPDGVKAQCIVSTFYYTSDAGNSCRFPGISRDQSCTIG